MVIVLVRFENTTNTKWEGGGESTPILLGLASYEQEIYGMNAATRSWKLVVVPVFVVLLLSFSLLVAYAEPSTSCSAPWVVGP